MSMGTGIANSRLTSEGEASSTQIPGLVIAARNVLLQGLELLQMSEQQYTKLVGNPFDASIGQHYRHVLEHFQCLVRGADSGEVNYDARQRDRRIETNKEFAAEVTRDLVQELYAWTNSTLEQKCKAVSSVDYEADLPSSISSNVARELAYCIGHTIHHYAIIRLVCGQISVNVPARFGYAPSTIKHQSSLVGH